MSLIMASSYISIMGFDLFHPLYSPLHPLTALFPLLKWLPHCIKLMSKVWIMLFFFRFHILEKTQYSSFRASLILLCTVMADLSLNPLFAHSTISSSFMADPQLTVHPDTIFCRLLCWICNLACAQRATETWRHTGLNCILTRSPPNIYLVSEELSCVAGLILVLWGTSILVPKVTVLCWRWTFPSAYVWGIF